jgi:glycosyltransferase involved in cell wall biosynthesis
MMIAPALRILLEKYRNSVSLVLVNSALKLSCEAQGIRYPFEGLPNVTEAERSVDINRYAPFAASFGFDIGIAPLVDCNFNRSKSNLRWLEYSALKVPCVATDISHFRETINHGKDGFLVEDNDLGVWLDNLERLVLDENLRVSVGQAAYKRVKNDFNVKKNAPKYLRYLKGVVSDGIPQLAEAI